LQFPCDVDAVARGIIFARVQALSPMLPVAQHVVQKNLDLLAPARNASMASILL
jgi:hypothetical protein